MSFFKNTILGFEPDKNIDNKKNKTVGDQSKKNQLKLNKNKQSFFLKNFNIKNLGILTEFLGYLKVIGSIYLIIILENDELLKDFDIIDYIFNIIMGVVFIILGNRIRKGMKHLKRNIVIIFVLSGVLGFINILNGAKTSMMILLSLFALYVLTQLKYFKK